MCLISACSVYHQKQSVKYEAIADAYLSTSQYANAIKYYQKAFYYRNEPLIAFKLGESYWLNRDFEKAEASFSPYIVTYQNDSKNCKRYAELAMCNANYDIAKVWWKKYGTLTNINIETKLQACDSAVKWLQNPNFKYSIYEQQELNTKYSEISPAFYPNGLVMASSRPGVFFEKESGSTGEPYFDLYISKIGENFVFSKPKFLSMAINTPEHETSAIFDSSGTIVYYTRGETDTTNALKIKILQSEKKTISWTTPKQFVLNDSTASFGQPFMNKKGNVFVFSSNIPGGFGGTDLYISFKKGNSWTKPENLGPIINTSENEYYPFLTPNGDLYFTSDGHIGMGGYDLFVARFTPQGWVKVDNLKAPINSPFDDLSIIVDVDHRLGYFASNRKGGKGKEDIYRFTFTE
jgi:peptidoglycan-associated lipoprotein